MILKPPAPSSPSIPVNPDYLTAHTNLGTQEFRENKIKLRVSHVTGVNKLKSFKQVYDIS